MSKVFLFDTTLRDGAQGEGISFSSSDKLKIARRLDGFGMDYIEGGFAGANPKDQEFFRRAAAMTWQNSRVTAFGATRYKNVRCEDDAGVQALVATSAPAMTIVAKFSEFQVSRILETDHAEGLAMITDTVSYLKAQGVEVIVDAEHFFDGFKADRDFTLACVDAAEKAGADWIALCDTNGGSLVDELHDITAEIVKRTSCAVGIHTHNDADLAAAGTLAGVAAGATQIHGTINGLGERTGNANLCTVIPNLQLKLGYDCVAAEQLERLTELSHYVSEIANMNSPTQMAYVGHSAFAHKAGYHASATAKYDQAYQHVDPATVGNHQRILVSELAGTASVASRAAQLGIAQSREGAAATASTLKLLEAEGFQFEGAEASFELILRRKEEGYRAPFELVDFMAFAETRDGQSSLSEAMVKIRINDEIIHTAGEGNGPVSALDEAFRKALLPSFPKVAAVRLVDYKVRILDSEAGTAAGTRVLILSSDGEHEWGTVGSSTNVVEASWIALADAYEFALLPPNGSGATK